MTTITQEDLIRYLYGETSEQKTKAIEIALQKDWKLKDSLEQLVGTFHALDKLKQEPGEDVIDRILQYGAKKQTKNVETH